MLEVAIEEKVPAISITGANPQPVFERIKGENIKTLVLVAGVRQAQKAEELGADAVIVVGQEGGGHLGRDDIGTIVLTPRAVDAVSIPVLASGGIGDGRGLLAALALGAEGIEMGTRFIATQECIYANEKYKQAILNAKETDTVIIKRTLGSPGRVLKTEFTLGGPLFLALQLIYMFICDYSSFLETSLYKLGLFELIHPFALHSY